MTQEVQWESHAKTVSTPKRLWGTPPEQLPPEGQASALQGKPFQMYDQRDISRPLPQSPDKSNAHGRVLKMDVNQVPAQFERAQRLADQGQLHQASKLLVKILENAQAHHRARRLLAQVSNRINQDLDAQRREKSRDIDGDDDARTYRSRFYTPSMVQEELLYGETQGGKEACEVLMRGEGTASPERRPYAPWLHPEAARPQPAQLSPSEEYPRAPAYQNKASQMQRPRSAGKGKIEYNEFPDHGAPGAWPAPAPPARREAWAGSKAQKGQAQNIWNRPPTHAQRRGSAAVERRQPEPLDSPEGEADHGSISEVDYQEIFRAEYGKMKDKERAQKIRAQIIRQGQTHHLLDGDNIIKQSLETVHARQRGFQNFAKGKLNQPSKDTRALRGVKVSSAKDKPPEPMEQGDPHRELRASTEFIMRMRTAKEVKPKYVPGRW